MLSELVEFADNAYPHFNSLIDANRFKFQLILY